jgi:hypothetical protein
MECPWTHVRPSGCYREFAPSVPFASGLEMIWLLQWASLALRLPMQHVGQFPRMEICDLCDIWMVTFMPVFYTLYSHCGPIHSITNFVSDGRTTFGCGTPSASSWWRKPCLHSFGLVTITWHVDICCIVTLNMFLQSGLLLTVVGGLWSWPHL